MIRRKDSLRRRLIAVLVPTLVVITILFGLGTTALMLRTISIQQDRALLDPVVALERQIRIVGGRPVIDLPASAKSLLFADANDVAIFLVRDSEGRQLAGQDDFPELSPVEVGEIRYLDAKWRHEQVRVVHTRALFRSVEGNEASVDIAVGETLNARRTTTNELLIGQALMVVTIAVVSAALMVVVTGKGLAPLEKIRIEIATRDQFDLRPLPIKGLPAELQPVLSEYNDLLARVAQGAEIQREFISEAAHQLRTPLAGLTLQVDLLRREPSSTPVRTTLDQIHGTCLRLNRMAAQLLASARVDARTQSPTAFQKVDLARVVEDVLERFHPTAEQLRIDLGCEIESVVVNGNEANLIEMAANLVDNALKYSATNGYVTIQCGIDDRNQAFLSVEDDGPGIAPQFRERIFERFVRLPGAIGEGTGLGLAIVRNIVQQHNAVIEVLEGPNGRGSCFKVTFAKQLHLTNDSAHAA